MKGRISKEFQEILHNPETRKKLREIVDGVLKSGTITLPNGKVVKIRRWGQ